MRKITQNSVNAFLNDQSYREGNTKVSPSNGKNYLYLHNNIIAVKDKETEKISITNAGWQTNTTKERLNGLPNVSIKQIKGQWYLNGQLWNGDLITILLCH